MHNFRLLSTKCLSIDQQNRLVQAGVTYRCWNFIETSPKKFEAHLDNKTLIFTSQNAVKSVFEQIAFQKLDCYCVGEKTKEILEENGQKVIKMAKNASLLADFILKNQKKEHFLFFTGNQRMPVLENAFKREKKALEVVETYTTTAKPKAMGSHDAVLFFSPSGVESFLQHNTLEQTTCFALGDTTAQQLQKHTTNIITATQPTINHLIVAVRKYMTTLV